MYQHSSQGNDYGQRCPMNQHSFLKGYTIDFPDDDNSGRLSGSRDGGIPPKGRARDERTQIVGFCQPFY